MMTVGVDGIAGGLAVQVLVCGLAGTWRSVCTHQMNPGNIWLCHDDVITNIAIFLVVVLLLFYVSLPSVFSHCRLGIRKTTRPVKY